MDLLLGNAHDADTAGTGWFLGFGGWTRLPGSDLLHVPRGQPLQGLCCKWFTHGAGHAEAGKPISEGRTLSVLVSEDARFEIDFSHAPGFDDGAVRTAVLQRHGDFVIWGAGLHHRWRCVRPATIFTVRWSPATGA